MKKHLIHLIAFTMLAVTSFSCKKDYDGLGPLEDSIADIPVTVANQEFFELVPIVTTSVAAGGNFTITFRIPAEKGKIKEISRIATGTNGLTNLQGTALPRLYNYNTTTQTVTPIAGNNSNEITFSSNLSTYTTYRTRVGPLLGSGATGLNLVGPVGAVAMTTGTPAVIDERNPTQIRFFFLLTLEDGREIIPTEVRVRVQP